MLRPMTLSLSLSLLIVTNLARNGAVACEGGDRPAIHVIAEPAPVSIAADFTRSELSDLAHRAGEARERAPLGFYTSTVQHTVSVQFESGPAATCAAIPQIELRVQLFSRRIEISRDMEHSCRYSAVLEHYQKKANADLAVFGDYVSTVASALGTTPLPTLQLEMKDASVAAARHQLESWVENIADQRLPSLRDARRAAFQAVDTVDEMRHLTEDCSQGA